MAIHIIRPNQDDEIVDYNEVSVGVLQAIAEDIRQRGDIGNDGPEPAEYLDHWARRFDSDPLVWESINGLSKKRAERDAG